MTSGYHILHSGEESFVRCLFRNYRKFWIAVLDLSPKDSRNPYKQTLTWFPWFSHTFIALYYQSRRWPTSVTCLFLSWISTERLKHIRWRCTRLVCRIPTCWPNSCKKSPHPITIRLMSANLGLGFSRPVTLSRSSNSQITPSRKQRLQVLVSTCAVVVMQRIFLFRHALQLQLVSTKQPQ